MASVLVGALAGLALTAAPAEAAGSGSGTLSVTAECNVNTGLLWEDEVDESFDSLNTAHAYEVDFAWTDDDGAHKTTDGGWSTNDDGTHVVADTSTHLLLPAGQELAWSLIEVSPGGPLDVIDGTTAVGGTTCPGKTTPTAPEIGGPSFRATNAGVIDVPLSVDANTNGAVEILQGAGVLASGSYSKTTSTSVDVKVKLTKAMMRKLWWLGSYPVSIKAISRNTSGSASTTETHNLQEPTTPDKPSLTTAQKTIEVSKSRAYQLAFEADPSLHCSIKVVLGSKTLNHSGDVDAPHSGEVTTTFNLSASAFGKLKSAKSEKVTVEIKVAKGNGSAQSTTIVTLKAPKT
jgi:hypothetical protein